MGVLIFLTVLLLIIAIYAIFKFECAPRTSQATFESSPKNTISGKTYKKIVPQAYKDFIANVSQVINLYDEDDLEDDMLEDFSEFMVQEYENAFAGEDNDPLSFEYLTFCTMLSSLMIPAASPERVQFTPQLKTNVFALFDFCFYMHIAIIELFKPYITCPLGDIATDFAKLYINFLKKFASERLGMPENDVEELILDRYTSYINAMDSQMRSYDNIDGCAVFAAREYLKMFWYKDFYKTPMSSDISIEDVSIKSIRNDEVTMPFFEILILEKLVLEMQEGQVTELLVSAYERCHQQ